MHTSPDCLDPSQDLFRSSWAFELYGIDLTIRTKPVGSENFSDEFEKRMKRSPFSAVLKDDGRGP
jgi:hypothetical protein